jgi:hypothetical protein
MCHMGYVLYTTQRVQLMSSQEFSQVVIMLSTLILLRFIIFTFLVMAANCSLS